MKMSSTLVSFLLAVILIPLPWVAEGKVKIKKIHKIPFNYTTPDNLTYQIEIPLILTDESGLYFVSWDKNSQTQRYHCDEDWFGTDNVDLNGVKVVMVN